MPWQPDYATADDLGAYVRIPEGDDGDDAQLALAVTAASRAIDTVAHRQFGQEAAPVARYYTARYDHARCRWVADIDDLQDSTGLAVRIDSAGDGTYADEITAYQLTPANAAPDERPWTRLEVLGSSTVTPTGTPDGVQITALWGWTAVPATIQQACLLQASRLLTRRDAPFGVAGSPEAGSELRLLARVDPDVEVTIRPYIRWRKRVG